MVSRPEEGRIKEARDEDNNIIIFYSTLRNILPPQLNNTTFRYEVMCGCECCISTKIIHSYLLTRRYICLKHLNDKSHNAQNIRPGEIYSHIFETYYNAVQPHGFHIYNNTSAPPNGK